MISHRSTNPILVYTPATLQEMMDVLWTHKILALDTESDSLFSYYPKVCLIQISTFATAQQDPAVVTDFLVDPLRFSAFGALGEFLADPATEVVIHAAENDIFLLQREFDFNVTNLFDTQLAARILGWPRAGLAAILEEHFGVVSNKKMQRTNWGRRPLTPEQVVYAQMDTHYLLALRARQLQELYERDRWEEAQEGFEHLTQIDYRARVAAERSIWQMKETRSVPHEQTGVLEALWLWREQEAQHQDRPPFKILGNATLVALAQAQPSTLAELGRVQGLSEREIDRYGSTLLQVLREGRQRPLPPLPERSARADEWLEKSVLDRYDSLRGWRAKIATARGVTPDIVLTNEVLLELAKLQPRTLEDLQKFDAIGPWKAKTYGPDLLRILQR